MINYKCDDGRYYYLYLIISKEDWDYATPPFYYLGCSGQKTTQRVMEHVNSKNGTTSTAVSKFLAKNNLPPARECCDIYVYDVSFEFTAIPKSDRMKWLNGLEQFNKLNGIPMFSKQMNRFKKWNIDEPQSCESKIAFSHNSFEHLGKQFHEKYSTNNRTTLRQVETYSTFHDRLIGRSKKQYSATGEKYRTYAVQAKRENKYQRLLQMEHFYELAYSVLRHKISRYKANLLWKEYHPKAKSFSKLYRDNYSFILNDFAKYNFEYCKSIILSK